MRNIDERRFQTLVQLNQLHAHGRTQLRIQVGERLVHQKDLRFLDHGACQRNALTLTAGEVRGLSVQIRRQTHDFADVRDERIALFLRHFLVNQTELNVLADGHRRIQRIILENHCQIALARCHIGNVHTVDENLTGGRLFKTRDHAQRGRFTAAGRTDQHGKGTVNNVQIQIRNDILFSVILAQID